MYLEETPEQQALRGELRAYFADLLTEGRPPRTGFRA